MWTIRGEAVLEHRHGRGLNAVKLRLRDHLCIAQSGQSLPRQLAVKEVLIGTSHGAVLSRGHCRLAVLCLVKAPSPIKRGNRLLGPGIEADLFVEEPRGIGIESLPVTEPTGPPVR